MLWREVSLFLVRVVNVRPVVVSGVRAKSPDRAHGFRVTMCGEYPRDLYKDPSVLNGNLSNGMMVMTYGFLVTSGIRGQHSLRLGCKAAYSDPKLLAFIVFHTLPDP